MGLVGVAVPFWSAQHFLPGDLNRGKGEIWASFLSSVSPLSLWDLCMEAQARTLPGPGGARPRRKSPCMTGCSSWMLPWASIVGSCSVATAVMALHRLQRGRVRLESHWLSSLGPQIRIQGDFYTVFLVLEVAGFGLCELVLEPGSPLIPQIVWNFNKDLFPCPSTFVLCLGLVAGSWTSLLFGNKNW